MSRITERIERVRRALDEAARDLPRNDWRSILEEIGADIDGHLDALNEEEEG